MFVFWNRKRMICWELAGSHGPLGYPGQAMTSRFPVFHGIIPIWREIWLVEWRSSAETDFSVIFPASEVGLPLLWSAGHEHKVMSVFDQSRQLLKARIDETWTTCSRSSLLNFKIEFDIQNETEYESRVLNCFRQKRECMLLSSRTGTQEPIQ